ncbi:MAG: CHRD domain-containing protein [Phycisphaerales bacterium]
MSKILTASAIVAAALATSAAQAHELVFTTTLSGPNEAPPNSSAGTGFSTVTIDLDLATMRIQAQFSGLTGNASACHIHGLTALPFAGTAGVMTPTPSFPGFPHGGTFGTYDRTLDLTLASSYNAAFVTASGSIANAMNRLIQSLEQSRGYLNIHTTAFPGGEIRGFYVPAPGMGAMLAGAGLLAARRRRA